MAGLYIHFPFCLSKCSYCDFYSATDCSLVNDYLENLQTEISLRNDFFSYQPIQSVYFGGGTPSLLTPGQIASILRKSDSVFSIDKEAEISIEMNPGTVELQLLTKYSDAGINRVSIGIQSFHEDELMLLGRQHSVHQAIEFIKCVLRTGFHSVGIDLIFGLPDQNPNTWLQTLEQAVALEPHHISTYMLTWSYSTSLGRKIKSGQYSLPDEDTVSEMYLDTSSLLSAAGYEHYEISNFSRPGHRCGHNEAYWTGEKYLGLGPSAHSYNGSQRFWNVSNINQYISVLSKHRLPLAGTENLNIRQKRIENLSLGLRRKEGIPFKWVENKKEKIHQMVTDGLAVIYKGWLSFTPMGFLMADEIVVDLI